VEIRQNAQSIPTRPIVLAMVILSVLALALTTWYALASGITSHPAQVNDRPYLSDFRGPDPYSPRDPLDAQNESSAGDPWSSLGK
jgi:hypothetical protein